jgi:hypothetical protein
LNRVRDLYSLHQKDLIKVIPDDLPIMTQRVGRCLFSWSVLIAVQVKESNNIITIRGQFESPLNIIAPGLLPPESRRAQFAHNLIPPTSLTSFKL